MNRQSHTGQVPAYKNGQKRYDWDTISSEYVQGYFLTDPETGLRKHIYPTLQDLANKYGCSLDTIRNRSGKESWSLRRDVFRSKIKEHIVERQVSTFLSESAQHDALTIEKVRKLHRLLDYYLRQYEDILDADVPLDYDPEFPLNLKDLEITTKILNSMHGLMRSVVGEPMNTSDRTSLIQDLSVLNPALVSGEDLKARKKRLADLQNRITLKGSERQKLLAILHENDEDNDNDATSDDD